MRVGCACEVLHGSHRFPGGHPKPAGLGHLIAYQAEAAAARASPVLDLLEPGLFRELKADLGPSQLWIVSREEDELGLSEWVPGSVDLSGLLFLGFLIYPDD
jgi:hypothetical protein